ncbi:hypothetical protein KPL70_021764 [Citrus sinensis]|nr:hypothetical protein KPL70_021764 [Citrus sinensis]
MGWLLEINDLEPKSFPDESKAVIDFIAGYYKNIEKYPVQSKVEPDYLSVRLPDTAPHSRESLDDILKDVADSIILGLTRWQSPNFFGYFQANASTAGFLGEMLCSGFNVVGFNWLASPAATELESIVMDWMGKMLKLPSSFLFSGTGQAYRSACICPEFRHYLNGVELADSVSLNPHKWFLTNMDCGCLWVKHSSFLVDSQSTKSDIMRNRSPASSTSTNVAPVIDYKDWQIALSRRFKALKLWTVIRKHGYSGLMYHIRSDVNMAKRFEAMVAKDERFETVEPRKCALVCFRLKPKRESDGSELNRSWLML